METRYVAVKGTNHYHGTHLFRVGMKVKLTKEPDNAHDEEAIFAEVLPFGKIGYVATSVSTVPKGCRSSGRIYDTFDVTTNGVIRFVVKDTLIFELIEEVVQ